MFSKLLQGLTKLRFLKTFRQIAQSGLYHLEVLNLKEDSDPGRTIEAKADEIQSSMRLSDGPLMKAGLFQCANGDHLLIAIHHLIIDGISWRILLEDIVSGYKQAENGRVIQLPQKTDSFQLWAKRLSEYAQSETIKQEQEYWTKIERLFPCDKRDSLVLIRAPFPLSSIPQLLFHCLLQLYGFHENL
jgi:NRPS condensation-like uncharacterized protein